MKNVAAVLFCIGICVGIALLYPRIVTSFPTVDETVCLECHEAGTPEVEGETIHGHHVGADCLQCHVDTPGDVPETSACIECHPRGDPGQCQLAILHVEDKGADCFSCHPECENPTTTTVTGSPCATKEIYGEDSLEVAILRSVRDNVLSKTPEGREIIRLYYQWSPVITVAIRNDKALKAEVKGLIDGILAVSSR